MPGEAPWGLYVHIPYCTKLCPYCDFNVHVVKSASAAPWEPLLHAMLQELQQRTQHLFANMPALHSVYFGGGTPALAPPWFMTQLLTQLRQQLGLRAAAEITLEANPHNLTPDSCTAWRAAGINRLSLGWQSMQRHVLKILGRQHSAADNLAALQAARQAGIHNISCDFIFAVPGQSLHNCAQDVQAIVAAQPAHISLYALSYPPHTAFARWRQQGRLQPVSETRELLMMNCIERHLSAAGYQHYEVSNYAQPGFEAQHNRLYWQGGMYLGLGPGAHSFCHTDWQTAQRWENLRQPQRYIQAWQPSAATATALPHVAWHEVLTPAQLFSERMLCALRQPTGIDLQEPICQAHTPQHTAGSQAALARGWATLEGSRLRPTPQGLRHADALGALFF